MELLNDAAATAAYAAAVAAVVREFVAQQHRPPTVLNVGLRGGAHAAACLAAGAAEVVMLSLDPAEIELAGRYLAAVGADAARWSVLRRSPMQLAPAEHQYDLLVLDRFGPFLNDHHAAVTARALWSRRIVRRFGERRYAVPVEAAASVRLCCSPGYAAASGHTVAGSGEWLAAGGGPAAFKWRPHPEELQPRSGRIEVLRERYDTPELDAIEWPAVVPAPPGPWPAGAVLLLEWALLLHPDHPVVTTTATELGRLPPVSRAARRAAWGAPRACAVAPGQPPPALTVGYRPGAGVSLAAAKAPGPSSPVYKQLPADRHARIVDAEFAKACKIDNSATAF